MLTSRRRLATAAVAIGLVLPAGAAAPALADHHPTPAGQTQQQVPDITDADFLGQAAQANRFEILTGQLAKQRSHTRIVRSLGKMFVKDHTAALAQGTAVAAKLGITPPAGLNAQQQASYDKLRTLHGRKFDRAWLKAQLEAHVQAVALHLRGALTGDTPDVRTLAILALPVVSQHLGELKVVAKA
jgi:predicted outer membrane protein